MPVAAVGKPATGIQSNPGTLGSMKFAAGAGSRDVGLTIQVPTEAEDLPSLESSSPTGLTPLLPGGISFCPAVKPLTVELRDSHGESDSPTGLTPTPRAADGFRNASFPAQHSSSRQAVSTVPFQCVGRLPETDLLILVVALQDRSASVGQFEGAARSRGCIKAMLCACSKSRHHLALSIATALLLW